MIAINQNFKNLPKSYLFSEVSRKIRQYKIDIPDVNIVRMDIGDVTLPLFPSVITAMHKATDDLSRQSTFHGYGPEQGYEFLRKAISEDYSMSGISIEADEIFVSDGAKSDLGNLGELFSTSCKVAVMNPAYPVYVDDNIMDGRAGYFEGDRWSNLVYLDCDPANGFLPCLPSEKVDIIYLCFPNNPTGVAISRDALRKWIEYARSNDCLIIYDSAYEAYVRNDNIVKSIYEIEGAKEVSIEVRSFSKTAGFTGLRCGYTVIPAELSGKYDDGSEVAIRALWNRRQTTKFNGASYISQCAAAAIYSEEGRREVRSATDYYLSNAQLILDTFKGLGYRAFGGGNSPYVWVSIDDGRNSWELFDFFLREYGFSTTPGSGFGTKGEGYVRLTGFNTKENTAESMRRLLSGGIPNHRKH